MWRLCNAALRCTNWLNNLPVEPQAPDGACSFTPASLLSSDYWRQCHLFWALKGCVLIKTSTLCLLKSRLWLSYSLIIDLPPSPYSSSLEAEKFHVFLITISLLHITVSLLHITVSLLHITIYLLHITISLLPITIYMLHITISLLHITILWTTSFN
jgi:hypothetical protein